MEVEVIRRKGDVIELPETELGPTTNAPRRLERSGTTTSKSNRPSTSDQVFEEAAPSAKSTNNSKCDGNNSIKPTIDGKSL